MVFNTQVSLPVIKRLPKYYRYLKMMRANGITSVSSRELANQMGTTASQVRQDLNCFGDVNGRQGIGYSVDVLLQMLEELLLGGGEKLPAILIGCGRLGNAVSRFIMYEANGFELIAAFDKDEEAVKRALSCPCVPVLHVDKLAEFCKEHKPQVAVLCVPREPSRQVCAQLAELGIRGFWNFSHYDLSVDYPDVVCENVHLGDSLMSLGYRLRNEE